MTNWSPLSPDELERRRLLSVAAMKALDREKFDRLYQEKCDRDYWRYGQRCSGCDHWQSDMGNSGHCTAAGIVSGEQVLRSAGIVSCSYTPAPGFPITNADFHCGLFRDDFDWSSLDREYLERIGAMKNGSLRPKPTRPPHAGVTGDTP